VHSLRATRRWGCRCFRGPKPNSSAPDLPHSDSTWPHSLQVIERRFEGVPESVKRKIVYGNAVSLYRMDLQ
jgi:hypothetical protein